MAYVCTMGRDCHVWYGLGARGQGGLVAGWVFWDLVRSSGSGRRDSRDGATEAERDARSAVPRGPPAVAGCAELLSLA